MAAPAAVFVAGEAWYQRHRLGLLAAVAIGGVLALMVAAGTFLDGAPSGTVTPASRTAPIPAQYLTLYLSSASTCPGLRWTLLAAVGSVESGHGANMGPSSAGALGSMQMLPATFAEYAPGAPAAAVMDPAVAIPAAARMLCADGAGNPATLPEALAAYGAAASAPQAGADYAARVLAEEARIIAAGPALIGAPGLTLSPDASLDALEAGLDPQLVVLLHQLAATTPITVGTLVTGHTADVIGAGGVDTGRQSNHTGGRAADITIVGGQPVSPGNLTAHQLVASLEGLDGSLRPSEVGSPFADLAPSPRWFWEPDHVHIGYDG